MIIILTIWDHFITKICTWKIYQLPSLKKKSPITIVLAAAKYSSVLTKVFLLISWVELIEADQEGIDLVFQVVPLPLLWMEG